MTDSPLRVGLVGVNTSHATAFARLLNGSGEEPPALAGARVVAIWGEPAARRDALASAHGIPRTAADPAQMVGGIDLALVIDDTGKESTPGRSHPALARIFLEAGIPTFVDKPMTEHLPQARSLFELALAAQVPLMSSSALRFARELSELRSECGSSGPPNHVESVAPNGWYYYGIHAVEMAQAIMGRGASWVRRFVWPGRDLAVIGYDDGRSALVRVHRDYRCGFAITACSAAGVIHRRIEDSNAFYGGLLAAAITMAETSVAPVAAEDTLEVLGILHAGLLSEERGESVSLAEAMGSR